ncbi:glucokinase [Saccharopolyspora shandongensis]|uniref:Glucokinase n=1 Tax=Saccharopolyspora shandongensis TaxID=418495 RepID=A0A1H2YS84_9PSEU|nr:ROK family protein [Saccharopolyspora shandongensis]SDX07638.1 glucokinase [Saccharopolyspora shandongensis]
MTAHAIAVDVGGTDMKAALVAVGRDAARQLRHARRPTPRGSDGAATADLVVEAVIELVSELRSGVEPVDAVGVVVPGVVDEARGVGVFSANLGWRDVPLRARLAAGIDLPLAFGHDVRAGGLAEARLGAARGMRDVVVLPIGTGIAAALVLDGRLHSGGGFAGEVGHIDVGHGEPCGCGSSGCVEAVASSAAVARRYRARTGRDVSGADVAAAVRTGDPDAQAVWQDAIDALARGLLVLVTIAAPECIVLGGGFAQAGDLLVEPLRARLDGMLAAYHRRPHLKLAELGDTAGCLGAALLATEGLKTT